MQAAEIDRDLQTHPSMDQTHLTCKFGASPFSGTRDIRRKPLFVRGDLDL